MNARAATFPRRPGPRGWRRLAPALLAALVLAGPWVARPTPVRAGEAASFRDSLYPIERLKPTDSALAVRVGDPMPDFDLPGIDGQRVRLSDYKGRSALVLSFVPAAWTPVCSGQWPGYNIAREEFEGRGAALVGVTVDNAPTLFSWVRQMGGLWFPVASDFWPHGGLAAKLGILRSDGVSERALFVVDRDGVIRYIDVNDINTRPDLGHLLGALETLR